MLNKNLDAQLNPHPASFKGGLLALPSNAFMLAARTQAHTHFPPPPPHSPLYISQLLEAGKLPPREIHDAVRWLVPVIKASHKVVHEVLQNIALLPDSRFIVSNVPTFFALRPIAQTFIA
jgi:hypothetical protein